MIIMIMRQGAADHRGPCMGFTIISTTYVSKEVHTKVVVELLCV